MYWYLGMLLTLFTAEWCTSIGVDVSISLQFPQAEIAHIVNRRWWRMCNEWFGCVYEFSGADLSSGENTSTGWIGERDSYRWRTSRSSRIGIAESGGGGERWKRGKWIGLRVREFEPGNPTAETQQGTRRHFSLYGVLHLGDIRDEIVEFGLTWAHGLIFHWAGPLDGPILAKVCFG